MAKNDRNSTEQKTPEQETCSTGISESSANSLQTSKVKVRKIDGCFCVFSSIFEFFLTSVSPIIMSPLSST